MSRGNIHRHGDGYAAKPNSIDDAFRLQFEKKKKTGDHERLPKGKKPICVCIVTNFVYVWSQLALVFEEFKYKQMAALLSPPDFQTHKLPTI